MARSKLTGREAATGIGRTMRALCRRTGVAKVDIAFAGVGRFYARAYPDRAVVAYRTRDALVAQAAALGSSSVSVQDVTAATEAAAERPLAVGQGDTPELALADLDSKLKEGVR